MKDKLIEIFKAGTHTDSAGVKHTYTEADLDKIVAQYKPDTHEAPIVVGHPQDNHPAYGWVESLKREGAVLFMKVKDVVPEFADAVKQGLYKKRSISLYPDMTLRHVGFLGAVPPAVKGLADIAFKADDTAVTFEFSESWKIRLFGGIAQSIRDFFIEKEGLEKADKIIPQWQVDELKKEDPEPEAAFHEQKTEDTVNEKERKELEAKLRAEIAAEFAEKQTAIETENAALKAEKEQAQRQAVRKDHTDFCDALIKEGKLLPAMKAKVVDFMGVLSAAGSIDFTEGAMTEKKEALAEFKGFLTALPKVVNFSTVATPAAAGKTGGAPADFSAGNAEVDAERLEIHNKATALMKADAKLTYTEAVKQVININTTA